MQTSKIVTGLGILAAVVALGLGIGWLATRGTAGKVEPTPLATSIPETTPASVKNDRPPRVNVSVPLPAHGSVSNAGPLANVLPTVTPANTITNWEEKLDEILGSDEEDTNKVKQLFTMFRQLPADGQEEVAQHLSNLVEDEDYSELGKLLTDAKLPEGVLDVLIADLLNRPNADKLPLLMEIVQNPNHPKRDEARDLLELYLDEDYSADPAKLKQKITEWLKENPD
jgi:hypothetical protein